MRSIGILYDDRPSRSNFSRHSARVSGVSDRYDRAARRDESTEIQRRGSSRRRNNFHRWWLYLAASQISHVSLVTRADMTLSPAARRL